MSSEDNFGANALQRILDGNCCAGCGLCEAVSEGALKMSMSEEGYLRPEINKPISSEIDNLIAEICPGMNLDLNSRKETAALHPFWGPVVQVRTGKSTDHNLAHHASSGGGLSAIILFLLDNKIVDYAVQVSASDVAPIENKTGSSRLYDDVYAAAGSRYGPSAPLKDLNYYLNRPGRFVLVGKPCDIAGARALASYDPRVDEKIPVFLSFFCAGVPSLEGTREILRKLGVEEENVERFKYRGDGWPGFASATTKDGRDLKMDYHSSWGKILTRHVQFRCKICPDGSGGFADIVCADAWHTDDQGYPLFEEEGGRSLIISRTQAGEKLLQSVLDQGYIEASTLDAAEIAEMQPGQVYRKSLILSRLIAMAVLRRTKPNYRGFQLLKRARTASLRENLVNFLGMVRRLIKSRR